MDKTKLFVCVIIGVCITFLVGPCPPLLRPQHRLAVRTPRSLLHMRQHLHSRTPSQLPGLMLLPWRRSACWSSPCGRASCCSAPLRPAWSAWPTSASTSWASCARRALLPAAHRAPPGSRRTPPGCALAAASRPAGLRWQHCLQRPPSSPAAVAAPQLRGVGLWLMLCWRAGAGRLWQAAGQLRHRRVQAVPGLGAAGQVRRGGT